MLSTVLALGVLALLPVLTGTDHDDRDVKDKPDRQVTCMPVAS